MDGTYFWTQSAPGVREGLCKCTGNKTTRRISHGFHATGRPPALENQARTAAAGSARRANTACAGAAAHKGRSGRRQSHETAARLHLVPTAYSEQLSPQAPGSKQRFAVSSPAALCLAMSSAGTDKLILHGWRNEQASATSATWLQCSFACLLHMSLPHVFSGAAGGHRPVSTRPAEAASGGASSHTFLPTTGSLPAPRTEKGPSRPPGSRAIGDGPCA